MRMLQRAEGYFGREEPKRRSAKMPAETIFLLFARKVRVLTFPRAIFCLLKKFPLIPSDLAPRRYRYFPLHEGQK